jgi:hypothetical protein
LLCRFCLGEHAGSPLLFHQYRPRRRAITAEQLERQAIQFVRAGRDRVQVRAFEQHDARREQDAVRGFALLEGGDGEIVHAHQAEAAAHEPFRAVCRDADEGGEEVQLAARPQVRVARAQEQALGPGGDGCGLQCRGRDQVQFVRQLDDEGGADERVQREIFHRAPVVEEVVRGVHVGAGVGRHVQPGDVGVRAAVHRLDLLQRHGRVARPDGHGGGDGEGDVVDFHVVRFLTAKHAKAAKKPFANTIDIIRNNGGTRINADGRGLFGKTLEKNRFCPRFPCLSASCTGFVR